MDLLRKEKKEIEKNIALRNVEFEKQEEMVLKLYKELPIFHGCMDATGIGKDLAERLHKKLGDRLESVTFTPETKEILAIDVKRGLENKEFLLANDKEFHTQIHSIKRTSNGGKYFKYDAARNESGHADSFWSWSLANHAIGDRKPMNFYDSFYTKRKENQEVKEINNIDDSIIINKGKSLRQVTRWSR